MTREQLEKYFERIKCHPEPGESESEVLRRIHIGHSCNIPFENLDVYKGKMLSLEPDDLYEKIVVNRRGGYCFEMNGLLAAVLESMGFKVASVLARISGKDRPFGGLSHRMNVVWADGRKWIADVGYGGDGILEPIEIALGSTQESFGRTYRVVECTDTNMKYALQVMRDGEFGNQFAFNDEPNLQKDFEICNFYTNCWPESGFRRRIMCTMPSLTGRVSVSDMRLKITEGGDVSERELEQAELPAVLKRYFGLDTEL